MLNKVLFTWTMSGQRLEWTKVRADKSLTFVHYNICPLFSNGGDGGARYHSWFWICLSMPRCNWSFLKRITINVEYGILNVLGSPTITMSGSCNQERKYFVIMISRVFINKGKPRSNTDSGPKLLKIPSW